MSQYTHDDERTCDQGRGPRHVMPATNERTLLLTRRDPPSPSAQRASVSYLWRDVLHVPEALPMSLSRIPQVPTKVVGPPNPFNSCQNPNPGQLPINCLSCTYLRNPLPVNQSPEQKWLCHQSASRPVVCCCLFHSNSPSTTKMHAPPPVKHLLFLTKQDQSCLPFGDVFVRTFLASGVHPYRPVSEVVGSHECFLPRTHHQPLLVFSPLLSVPFNSRRHFLLRPGDTVRVVLPLVSTQQDVPFVISPLPAHPVGRHE